MGAENESPFLLQFMFGESAGLARQVASERLLRWCRALDEWLAERRRVNRHSTYRGSLMTWKRLLSRCPKTPWEITPGDLRKHIDWMQAQGYAASSIVNDLSTLSRFYDWCAQQQVDPTCGSDFNPVAQVPRPKSGHYARATVLSSAEVRQLLAILAQDESIIGRRDYAFTLARMNLGVKLKWLRQLQWGQIERDQTGTWLRLEADKARTACPPQVWEALHAYLEAAGRIESMRAEDYIFAPLRDPLKSEASGQAGDWKVARCLSAATIRNNLKQYARLAGIPADKLTLPALRHTAVLLRLEAGDSQEQIQAFLGPEVHAKMAQEYMRNLPPLQRDDRYVVSPEGERWSLPQRKPNRFKLGEGIIHGLYTRQQPVEELEAVLAEDLEGMQDEFMGLRILARKLFTAHSEAESDDEIIRLGEAYTIAADQIRKISKAEGQRGEPNQEAEWVDEFLAMLDNVAALVDEEEDDDAVDDDAAADDVATGDDVASDDSVAADDGSEELPSEEFWRTFAEGDPEMGAASRRLTEQIASLRLVLRRLFQLAVEAPDAKALMRYVNLYGRGCIRLARLLKAEKGAQGRAVELLGEMIDEVILEVNEEWGFDL